MFHLKTICWYIFQNTAHKYLVLESRIHRANIVPVVL